MLQLSIVCCCCCSFVEFPSTREANEWNSTTQNREPPSPFSSLLVISDLNIIHFFIISFIYQTKNIYFIIIEGCIVIDTHHIYSYNCLCNNKHNHIFNYYNVLPSSEKRTVWIIPFFFLQKCVGGKSSQLWSITEWFELSRVFPVGLSLETIINNRVAKWYSNNDDNNTICFLITVLLNPAWTFPTFPSTFHNQTCSSRQSVFSSHSHFFFLSFIATYSTYQYDYIHNTCNRHDDRFHYDRLNECGDRLPSSRRSSFTSRFSLVVQLLPAADVSALRSFAAIQEWWSFRHFINFPS